MSSLLALLCHVTACHFGQFSSPLNILAHSIIFSFLAQHFLRFICSAFSGFQVTIYCVFFSLRFRLPASTVPLKTAVEAVYPEQRVNTAVGSAMPMLSTVLGVTVTGGQHGWWSALASRQENLERRDQQPQSCSGWRWKAFSKSKVTTGGFREIDMGWHNKSLSCCSCVHT